MASSKHEGIRVVAFGGGTGLPVLLRGLRETVGDGTTAVVTVADDGGSSGRRSYARPKTSVFFVSCRSPQMQKRDSAIAPSQRVSFPSTASSFSRL